MRFSVIEKRRPMEEEEGETERKVEKHIISNLLTILQKQC